MLMLSAKKTALSASRHQAVVGPGSCGVFYDSRKEKPLSDHTLKGSIIFLQPLFSDETKVWDLTDVH